MDRTQKILAAVLGFIALGVIAYLYYSSKKPKTTGLGAIQGGIASPRTSLPETAAEIPPLPSNPTQEEINSYAQAVAAANGLSEPVSVPTSQQLQSAATEAQKAQTAVQGLTDAAGLATPNPATAQAAATVAAATGAKYSPYTDAYGNPITYEQYVQHVQNAAVAANPTQTQATSAGVTMYQIPGTTTYVTRAAYLAYLRRVNG